MATTIPSTATTTRLERIARAIPWRTVLPLAVGLALVASAILETLAAWAALEARAAVDNVYQGNPVSDAELGTASANLEQALRWKSGARWLSDLATLELVRARRLQRNDPERHRLLQDAEEHFIKALLLNPADGFAWYNLALVRMAREDEPGDIIATLMQSLDMAPSARSLWVPRVEALLSRWPGLNPEEREAVQSQLRAIVLNADDPSRRALFAAAIGTGQVTLLRQSLGDDPEALEIYGKLHDRMMPADR